MRDRIDQIEGAEKHEEELSLSYRLVDNCGFDQPSPMTPSGRRQTVIISPKQTLKRPLSGKAAAQPEWQCKGQNWPLSSSKRSGLNYCEKVGKSSESFLEARRRQAGDINAYRPRPSTRPPHAKIFRRNLNASAEFYN